MDAQWVRFPGNGNRTYTVDIKVIPTDELRQRLRTTEREIERHQERADVWQGRAAEAEKRRLLLAKEDKLRAACAVTPTQVAAIAEVVDLLDVYAKHLNLTGHQRAIRMVNKCHLVTHLADLFYINRTFEREAFYDACGLTQEERYLG